ncbi:unnamed protein product [Mesocestoides corti]|uniref:Uncharacterized protein n=1 Tax=Mesocestoides corti TaxID=53468 RepID=A0A3P6GGZ6_MESCO|nr:unnamed protein product [Mesocestoides corti]
MFPRVACLRKRLQSTETACFARDHRLTGKVVVMKTEVSGDEGELT